jgi:hypothetical protein
VHDVKVFHVTASGSKPLPAQIAILVGGVGEGKLVPGRRGGKRFSITGVRGAEVALTRHTGPRARISIEVGPICRANASKRYFVRASVVIDGDLRRAYIQSTCRYVLRVLANGSRIVNHTTFFFED